MKLAIVSTLVSCAAAFTPSAKPAFSTSLNMAGDIKPKLAYVDALALEDLPAPGRATSVVAGGLAICIAVDPSGKIFAVGDKCPPVNQPMSACKVIPGALKDPVLGTEFSLTSGEVLDWCPSGLGKLIGGIFDPVGVPTFATKTSKQFVQVQVDVNAKAAFEASYWSGVLDAQGKADGKYY
mmetsp:Transcript_36828/g.45036  ORF Transcript_36828/g.45036 Transcript_36828/m.45036 type:complete len:181 (+) Transcript_36828:191-733(+)|eukprot:CAMPEP_0172520278 /NCGR_PEP_ID=MMETSP1066-20121228/291891_1 /TAXON_ID=671091 /ORGANISM="Coscinodiscus wailesii, Strain CCMP2513" /LENGTH=180 /DNA_ID=CAMNT_0013303009 /DNA_START=390 /DNA_END=932 /DNA_ORIENTATION=-